MIGREYTGFVRRRKVSHHCVVSVHMPATSLKEVDAFKAARAESAPSHTTRLAALVISQYGPRYS